MIVVVIDGLSVKDLHAVAPFVVAEAVDRINKHQSKGPCAFFQDTVYGFCSVNEALAFQATAIIDPVWGRQNYCRALGALLHVHTRIWQGHDDHLARIFREALEGFIHSGDDIFLALGERV